MRTHYSRDRFLLIIVIFTHYCCTTGELLWENIMNNLPDPRTQEGSSRCGLSLPTTEYSICDPERTLTSASQEKVANQLRTLESTRYHGCLDGSTPAIKLSLMLGSPKFGEGVLVPKVDFAEEVTELILEKLSSPSGKSTERSCGSSMVAFVAALSCPPILVIRCDRAKEPLIPEQEYPVFYHTLFKKMQFNATCVQAASRLPAPNPPSNATLFLEQLQQNKQANRSISPASPDAALFDLIQTLMERFPVRPQPIKLPPAQESLEEVEELEEIEVPEGGKVIKKRVPVKRKANMTKAEMKEKRQGATTPLESVVGEVSGAFHGAEEIVQQFEHFPKSRLISKYDALIIFLPSAPPAITTNIWKYLTIALGCVIIYFILMEMLHQILKRRMSKYSHPFLSEVNVDVLAISPDLTMDHTKSYRSRKRDRSVEGRKAFGTKGAHGKPHRRESSSQPPPESSF